MDNNTQKLVGEFLAIETQDEKCSFFHAHPELASIFCGIHFPKPDEISKTETEVTTK